jgi:DNA-binding CsgD family transcriptional regulator
VPPHEGKTDVRPFRPARGVRPDEVACLELGSAAGAPRVFALREGTSLVGRAPSAEVSLDADGVSRHHAKLTIAASGEVSLVDLDSTNGTFVNRAQIQRAILRENDEIQLGPSITLRFVYRREQDLARMRAAAAPRPAEPEPGLTPRELEVARRAALGQSNVEIGQALAISPRTVNSHLTKIYDRLDVHSRAALAMYLLDRGLMERGRG